MKLLENWKIKNGLNYKGWFRFVVKRWLRKHGLGKLIPFDMLIEWDNGYQVTLTIWEWGRKRKQKMILYEGIDYNQIMTSLRDSGLAVSSKDKYLVLQTFSNI
mgnify:CR=1 FL=1